jgi:hypothetical protein
MFLLSPVLAPFRSLPKITQFGVQIVDRDTLSELSGLLPESLSLPNHADQITFEYVLRIWPVKGQLQEIVDILGFVYITQSFNYF